jgi:uncharacterized Fe-S cluster protein YjdI
MEYIFMGKENELFCLGYKAYENDEIEVFWNPNICFRCANCTRKNKDVFNFNRVPWIDLSKSDGISISKIIDECPSHALQYDLKQCVRVVYNPKTNSSEAYIASKRVGECDVVVKKDEWYIINAAVNLPIQTGKILYKLVLLIINEARKKKAKIVPLCPYARKIFLSSPQFDDVYLQKS